MLTPLVGLDRMAASRQHRREGAPGSDGAATEEAAAGQPAAARPRSRKKARAVSPQEEWSLFDPEQCGFAALLAKLDQMAD